MSKNDTKYTLYVLIGLIVLYSLQFIPTAQAEWHIAKLKWFDQRCNGLAQGVTLAEPDRNKNPKSIDSAQISIISDSDPKGITVNLQETGIDTGIFEGTVVFSFNEYVKKPLAVYNGDRVTATYQDTTLPTPVFSGQLGISDTCIYTSGGPPLERVPTTSIGVFDKDGNQIDKIKVDQQIRIRSDLANTTIQNQTFAYIVQIQNQEGIMQSLSWLTGALAPSQAFSPSISWTPDAPGNYTANVFVWESISNPNALSPPISVDLIVLSDSTNYKKSLPPLDHVIDFNSSPVKQYKKGMGFLEIKCKDQFKKIFKPSNNFPACVKPESYQKLILRGWFDKMDPTKLVVPRGDLWSQHVISRVMIPLGSANPENPLPPLIPQTITVVLGVNNTVEWTNQDETPSKLNADDETWTTGTIKPGESAKITFNRTGVFGYHGEPHPWKKGSIIVLPNGSIEKTIHVTNSNFSVNYLITNGTVLDIKKDQNSMSLIVSVQSNEKGLLVITIPRALVDAKMGIQDDRFFVLIDGEEVNYNETVNKSERTLTIEFPPGAKKVEIIATSLI